MPRSLGAQSDSGLFSLACGAGMLLASSLAAAGVLPPRLATAGRRAIAHWAPIAFLALTAMGMRHPEMAVALVFGTSLALLSMVAGTVASVTPIGPAPPGVRRLWAFPLAAALLCFVAGFSGHFTWRHAAVLLVEGLVLCMVWMEPAIESPPPFARLAAGEARPSPAPVLWALLAVVLMPVGAFLAIRGADLFSQQPHQVDTLTMARTILSLALALPLAYTGRVQAARGASAQAMTTQVGVILLNLCLLLPALALWPCAAARSWATPPDALLYPLAVWRMDTVVLIVLSLLFVPIAAGKWGLRREEGLVLVVGYFVYMLAAVLTGGTG